MVWHATSGRADEFKHRMLIRSKRSLCNDQAGKVGDPAQMGLEIVAYDALHRHAHDFQIGPGKDFVENQEAAKLRVGRIQKTRGTLHYSECPD